jgi:hypothetical protein
MSIDDRDWYRERQKKLLDEIIDGTQQKTSNLRIFITITIVFLFLFAAFDYSRKGIVWQFLEKEGKYRHFDKRSDDERKVDAQVDTWKENKGLENGICKDNAYASAEDISQFAKKVDLFLKKVATEKKRHQSENIDITESQLSLENLSREGNELTRFYNKKLVRCYANQVTADLVSKQAKSVNTSINDLSKSFQKISAEK